MVDAKNSFLGGLDLDTDFFSLRKETYVDALNITRDAFTSGRDLAVTNIVGNRIVNYSLPEGTNQVIGALGVLVRNTVLYCVYNSNGKHSILEYNNTARTITKVFENLTDSDNVDVLSFNTINKISSMNIYIREEGDLFFFLDSLGRPTFLNTTRFKNGEYTPVTRQILNVHKSPPLSPPTCVYDNDATVNTNDLRNKLFRFRYRWIYDDDFKSTWSPISAVPYPVSILDPVFTNDPNNNNVIHVQMNSGPKNVKAIELAVSFVNKVSEWPQFQSVAVLNKADESIADDLDFNFNFYNDSTYPFINLAESNLLFDWIPRYAESQEMPNGNVLCYGGVTEGYDKDLEPDVEITINTVEAGNGGTIGSLNGVFAHVVGNVDKITFSGTPATGTVIEVYILVGGSVSTLAATYTTVSGDTAADVAAALEVSFDNLGITITANAIGSTIFFTRNFGDTFGSLVITPPASSADDDSIPTWKWSTSRNIGIIYYDENGVTNGVLYNAKIVFPAYAENGSQVPLLPYINVKIFHVPPDWAYSYQFVMTKEPTTYLFWECIDVNTDESEYLYFDVSNISLNASKNPTVGTVLSYSFQDGDRMRLIRRMADGTVYNDTHDIAIEGQVVDPTISGTPVSGTFIKIQRVAPFAAIDYSSDFFVIEIFRPGQAAPNEENQPFFEFGEEYRILDPTTDTRRHGGEVTDQSTDYVTPAEVNLYEGDSYFRSRTVYISETGFGTFNVQDRNFVDFYSSAVNSIEGRPVAIELNARSATYGATLRHGQAYQPNTNVNGLNRFFPEDLLDCDLSYGNIGRLKVRDRFMRVFQKLKVGMIPLFNQISKDNAGNEIQVQTGVLLNPVNYYVGDFGIGTAKSSLASYNYADYFFDNVRGAIIRVSNDGNTNLSVLYKVNSWAVAQIPLRTGDTIYGAYDQRSNNYIGALELVGSAGSLVIPRQGKSGILAFNFEVAGTPNSGDTLTVTLQDGDGIIRTYSYESTGGQTANDMITQLAALINADVYFTATILATVRISIRQVTSTSPVLFNGEASVEYNPDNEVQAQTIAFDEETNAFESFLSFHPEMMCSLGVLLISFRGGALYTHDSTTYNQFYGVDYESTITPVFNDVPLIKKSPLSLAENSSSIWDCPEIYSNVMSYGSQRQQTNLVEAEFSVLESMPTAAIKRDVNSAGGKINGNFIKGNWLAVKFRKQNASSFEYLAIVQLAYNQSPLNKVN